MSELPRSGCSPDPICKDEQCVEKLCRAMKAEHGRCFSYLSLGDVEHLSDYFGTCHLLKDGYLCREGEICTFVAFIVNGRLEIKKNTEFEGKQVVVGIYTRGAMVGELCILDNSPRAVTAVAMEDTDLLILSGENFSKLTAENPELGVKLLQGMLFAVSTRLKRSLARLASIF